MVTLLLLVLAVDDAKTNYSDKVVVTQDATKAVENIWKEKRRHWPKEPDLGPTPKTKPIGKIRIQVVTQTNHRGIGSACRLTYFVKIPKGGESHYRIEVASVGDKRADGVYRTRRWRRAKSTLPEGTTKKQELFRWNGPIDPPELFILVARSVKTHEHIILDVVANPLVDQEHHLNAAP